MKRQCDDGEAALSATAKAARSRQVWLLFWLRVWTQAIRMVWAPLVVHLGKDPRYNVASSERGGLLASFSLGYLMTQVLGGVLADRFGGAPLASAALFVDGAAMLLAPFCGSLLGVQGIAGCYFAMGLFSGVAHPAYNNILAAWVPQRDIGRASNLGEAGSVAGTLLATSLAPALAAAGGWPTACYAFGAVTLAFWAVWLCLAASRPPDAAAAAHELEGLLNNSEPATDDDIEENGSRQRKFNEGGGPGQRGGQLQGAEEPRPMLPPAAVLTYLPMWAVILQHICFNGHRYFFVEWMPTYFDDVFHMPPSRSCFFLSMPELLGLAAPGIVGPLERFLLQRRGWSLLDTRRFFGCIGFLGMAVVVLRLSMLSRLARSLAAPHEVFHSFLFWFSLNPLFHTMHSCGYKANYMDLTQDYSGLFLGFGNTFATMGNYIMPLGVGVVLRTSAGDWAPAFQCICFLDTCAAVTALLATSVERIDPWLASLRQPQRAGKPA